MYQFVPGEGAGPGIRRIVSEKILETVDLLGAVENDPATSFHVSRKNIKRIRAALRLSRDSLGEQRYRKENEFFRDWARKLAALRDAEVMTETISALPEGIAGPDFDQEGLRDRLHQDLERIIRETLMDPQRLGQIRKDLEASLERVKDWEFKHSGYRAFSGGFYRIYRQGKRQMKKAYLSNNDPQAFHYWRKRVKYLWHIFEILRPVNPDRADARVRDLKKVARALGKAHDIAVLAEKVSGLQENSSPEARQDWVKNALQRHNDLVNAVRPLARNMYRLRAGKIVGEWEGYWRAARLAV